MRELIERMLDRVLGPREWCVVDDCMTPGLRHDNIYAVLTSRRCNSDLLLAHGLRRRAAQRLARALRTTEQHSPLSGAEQTQQQEER